MPVDVTKYIKPTRLNNILDVISKKLAELELISTGSSASAFSPDKISAPDPNQASSGGASSSDVEKPQVVINESSNELFIKANPEQHSDAFEESENEFQDYENIPGLESIPMQPDKVLKDYK